MRYVKDITFLWIIYVLEYLFDIFYIIYTFISETFGSEIFLKDIWLSKPRTTLCERHIIFLFIFFCEDIYK